MPQIFAVRTPCIGVCSTGIGDSVCRGCKRFDYEVIHWNSYSNREKAAIDARLSAMLSDIVARRLRLDSVTNLERQLQAQQIRYPEWRDAYCWLYELLKAGASQIDKVEDYGFSVNRLFDQYSLAELREQIDTEFYAASVAHFERYIVANQRRATTVSE